MQEVYLQPHALRAPGIYKITQISTGRTYIGSAGNIRKRLSHHRQLLIHGKHHSVKMQRAWNKYGASDFSYSVVEIVHDYVSRLLHEQHFIDVLTPWFNTIITVVGPRNEPMADETKAKISATLKGRVFTEQHRLNLSASMKGRKISENQKAEMSRQRKGRTLTDEAKSKIGQAHLGRKRSDETRLKISNANKGRKMSPEQIAKQAASRIGRKHTSEHCEKIASAHRGQKRSAEARANMSAAQKKCKHSPTAFLNSPMNKPGYKQSAEMIAKRIANPNVNSPESRAKIAATMREVWKARKALKLP